MKQARNFINTASKRLQQALSIRNKEVALIISISIMAVGLTVFSFEKPVSSAGNETTQDYTLNPGSAGSDISGNGGNETDKDNTDITVTPTVTSSPTPSPSPTPTPNPLEKDAYQEVNDLISSYYQAKLDCNLDDFTSLVTDTTQVDIEYLQKQYEFVNSFQNITCYTKKGIGDIAYVVFIGYDSEIATITTLVPSLDRLCLTYAADGTLRVMMEEPTEEENAYIDTLMHEDDVVALYNEILEKFNAALDSDEALKALYDQLNTSTSGTEESTSGE